METGTLFWANNVVFDFDLDPVSPVRLNERSWELIVNKDNFLRVAIRRSNPAADCEVVVSSDPCVGSVLRVGPANSTLRPREAVRERLDSISFGNS